MDSPREIAILVLAAGKGTRMKSGRTKVLHPLAGRPMLDYPIAAAATLAPSRLIVVVGCDAGPVQDAFAGRAEFVVQAEQRGTGHAVLQARSALRGFRGDVLILYGDTPLLRAETLARMVELKAASGAELVVLSAPVDVPGIIVRDVEDRLVRIVEATDATPAELSIEERNTGVYLIDSELLWKCLAQIDANNEQGELYLTSIIEILLREGRGVEVLRLAEGEEGIGVNNRADLARAAAALRSRKLNQLMLDGVTIIDPASTYIDVDVVVGRDTTIEPGCVIQGDTRIGERVHVKSGCVIEASHVDDDAAIGPSAHLRPGTRLGRCVRIGNFVEVKNSVLGEGVKADHLSYIGDADVGAGASFGCGSIVVNYDGVAKHRTTVGERAFIGCNANLIAPVTIDADSFVAAGSTITRDVPSEALAVARGRQRNVEGWVARRAGRVPAGETRPAARKGAAPKTRKQSTRKAKRKTATRKTAKKPARKTVRRRRGKK